MLKSWFLTSKRKESYKTIFGINLLNPCSYTKEIDLTIKPLVIGIFFKEKIMII